jgi:hypothetical protein
MAESDLHTKLDRLLAGQVDQAKAIANLETGIDAVVQGVSGLVPLLGTHTEMLGLLLQTAAKEAPGDTNLGELLTKLLTTMERVETAIIRLPRMVQQAVHPAASDSTGPEPGQGG